MDDDDDLLGISSMFGRVGTSKADTSKTNLREAWKTWVTVTERPESRNPNERFAKAYKSLTDQKHTHSALMQRIRAAAYLEPHKRDPYDVGRVISCMKSDNIYTLAVSLMASNDAHKYLWETDESVEEVLCPMDQLEDALQSYQEDWSSTDIEKAGYLVTQMNPQQMREAAKRVLTVTGEPAATPSLMVKYAKVWRNPDMEIQVVQQKGRDSYSAGAKASVDMETVNLEADAASKKLAIAGCPTELIAQFHHLAPQGYWDRVEECFDADMTTKEAYSSLQDEFDWHPRNREKPTW